MISFGDINNAPKSLKSFLITLVTIPFWYICVYIYYPELYETKDHFLIFCFCFCINLICTFIISISSTDFGDEKHVLDLRVALMTVIIHSMFLSIWMSLTYIWSLIFNKIFYFFPFSIIFIIILLIIINFPGSNKSKE